MNIDEYTEILRCPQCAAKARGELTLVKENWLACDCGRQYPIVEGIPVMLPDEGEKWFKVALDELPTVTEHDRFVNS